MKARIEDRKKCGIYCIFNTKTGKRYVGKSINIHGRIKAHITGLNRRSKDENRHLINSYHKHGRSSFGYEVLEYLSDTDLEKLKERELFWMEHLKCLDRRYGYNLRKDSSSNMIVHEETRIKLSNASKNRREKFPDLHASIGKKTKKFWEENPEIKLVMAEKVSIATTNYTIIQLDKDMGIVNEYPTQKYLKSQLPDYYLPAILQVCGGLKSSYKGFYWRYRDISTGLIREVNTPQGMMYKVKVISKRTGTVKVFNTAIEAVANTDVTKDTLYYHLKHGKQPKHSKFNFYKV